MIQQVCIIGIVATEPRHAVTGNGVAMCNFRLASSERRYDRTRDSWQDGDTNWFTVTAFRSLAEHAAESFSKGDRIIVSGRLRVRQWERDGKQGTAVDVDADALGHDLRWGTTTFAKANASTATGAPSHEGTEHSEGGPEPEGTERAVAAIPTSTVPGGHWGDLSDNPQY